MCPGFLNCTRLLLEWPCLLREAPLPDAGDQRARGRLRFGPELAVEQRCQSLVLLGGLLPPTGQGEEANQRRVSIFVERLGGDQALQRGYRQAQRTPLLVELGKAAQQCQITRAERRAAPGCPILVQVLGQKISAIAIERLLCRSRVGRSPGILDRRCKGVDVGLNEFRRTKSNNVAVAVEEDAWGCTSRAQSFPGTVQGDTEVVCGGGGLELRPERVCQLLPMQSMRRLQRKQLHNCRGALLSPAGVRHWLTVHKDPEAA